MKIQISMSRSGKCRLQDQFGHCLKGCRARLVAKGAVCPFDIEGKPELI